MTRQPFNELPAPIQAGMLCNDPQFQEFAAIRSGFPGGRFSNSASAEYLRQCCHIKSRAELATNEAAQRHFAALQTEFDEWSGRIASRR